MEAGSIAAWVAFVPTAISAIVAVYNAKKSSTAANDAREALAINLRPEFVANVSGEPGEEQAELYNVARHDALDVQATVHLTSQKVGEGEMRRVSGRVPNVWGDDAEFCLPLPNLPRLEELGSSYDLVVVLQFFDSRKVHHWRQELRITRTLVDQNGRPYIMPTYHQAAPIAM